MPNSNDKSTSKDKKKSVKRNNENVISSISDIMKNENVRSSISDIIKDQDVRSAFENNKQCITVKNENVISSISYIIKDQNVKSAFENILESLKSLKINDEYSEKFSREEDLENLKESYKNKKLVLVLGSGVSIECGLPNWNDLLEKLLINVLDSNHKESIDSKDLAKIIISFFKNNLFLLRNIQYKYQIDSTQNNSTRISFENVVRDVLYKEFDENKNNPLFEQIKQMITKLDSIITLNYDNILEKYLKDENIKSIYIDEKTNFDAGVLPIYHVHGYLPEEKPYTDTKIIFSEEDYHQIYSDVYCWSNLIQIDKFTNNTCLFIGTSLSDPNLRRLLDVSKKLQKNKSFHYMLKKLNIDEEKVSDCISKTCENIDTSNDTDKLNIKKIVIDEIKRLQEDDAYSFGIKIIWVDDDTKLPDCLSKILNDTDNL
jgi:hypothetical protein